MISNFTTIDKCTITEVYENQTSKQLLLDVDIPSPTVALMAAWKSCVASYDTGSQALPMVVRDRFVEATTSLLAR